ncbi:hypothetical protein INT43_001649 [Umbelopsis isabellina]|uniref:FAD-binding domain-containing protein n=1 Tax=Mortierella isabellina TaxID=91625 RepID=A0A8H7PRE2_MORIS|nr:hypothetical protein INT43_001649 [Umbelopsis isabellina]
MIAKQNFAHVTTLIVGAGPAGSFLASNLARLGVQFRIIDKLKVHTTGRAIGLVARTLEILEQVCGSELVDNLVKSGHRIYKQGFWRDGKLTRKSETWECDSLHNYYLINPQLNLEDALRNDIVKLGHQIEYGVKLVEVSTPEDPDEPLLCTLQNETTGELEYVTCKYLIGSDGAHSFVRRSMAVTAAGETPNMVWGIIDAHLKTDFKDIEDANVLYSNEGTAVAFHWGNGITRLAMYLGSPDIANDVVNYRDIRNYLSIDQFIQKMTSVFKNSGYKVEIGEVKWFSIFKIQEKIATEWTAADGRVILLGDACHTHSPGGGLGMQAAIMDAYNLSWKMNLVEKGFANVSILETYTEERRAVAEQFIETSAKIIRVMSNITPSQSSPGLNSSYEKELALLYKRNGQNITVGPAYPFNELNWAGGGSVERNYAFWKSGTTISPGQRAPDVFHMRQYNLRQQEISNETRLFQVTKHPGIFNILIFAKNLDSDIQYHLSDWAAHLSSSNAFFAKYKFEKEQLFAFHTITSAAPDTIDEVNEDVKQFLTNNSTILLEKGLDEDLSNLDDNYYGFRDVTAAEQREQTAHVKYGIPSDETGVILALRPDGYVGAVVCLEDWVHLDEYFDTILGNHNFNSNAEVYDQYL